MDEKSGSSLPSIGADAKKRRVTYFYEPSIGDHNYGEDHPMKPQRIRMTHNLSVFYGLDRLMEVCVPYPASPDDIRRFHSADYVDFISSVTPATIVGKKDPALTRRMRTFNIGGDCPAFEGLFGFCQASAGGSIGAAVKLNRGDADIAINWAGGLHHAKKGEASGFCYVNDIVLGILELLKHHKRVLYVDIDIHHGDGVEEAFYTTDRVMTVSFHKFGDYFPGTGHIKDVGRGPGKYYALNVPLSDGIDDESFQGLFRPLIQKVMEVYQPEAVVLQCGADSLAGDKLGCFNLSIRGHASCLHFLRSFNVPLMVLGGGGYTIGNVARCWCYETAVAVNVEPDDRLPINEFCEYFGPDFTLHLEPSKAKNQNSPKDLECIRNVLLEYLSKIQHAPSMQFQARPPDAEPPEEDEEEDMDYRKKRRMWKDENYESETEEDQNPRTCSNPPSVSSSNSSSSAEKRAKGKSVPEEQNSANQAPQEKNFPLKSNWSGGSDLYEILTKIDPAMMEEWIPELLKADGGLVRRDDSVEDPEVPRDEMKFKEVSYDEARKLALIKAAQVIHDVHCLCVKDEALEKRAELAEEENELLKVADVEKSWLLKDLSRQREAFEEKLVKSEQNVQDLRKEVKKVEQDRDALQERVRLLEKDRKKFHNRYQSKLNLCCIQTFRIAWEQALLPEQERDIAGPDAYDVLCGFAPGESIKMVERLKASGLNGCKDSLCK